MTKIYFIKPLKNKPFIESNSTQMQKSLKQKERITTFQIKMNWVYIPSPINVLYEPERWCNFLGFFFYICVRRNTKTNCSEINADIRLYMTFETLALISCTDDQM